jgi:hypothetical protein
LFVARQHQGAPLVNRNVPALLIRQLSGLPKAPIGYRPSTETFNKQFHQLKAPRQKKVAFEVRTRSVFFGITDEEAKQFEESPKQ